MSSESLKPQNLPEAIVWYFIVGTYVVYIFGAYYLVTAFIGTFLLWHLVNKWRSQTDETPEHERVVIAPLAWAWLGAIMIVELALIVSHFNYELGIGKIIISTSHWYRTWAIFAIFPLVGHLEIRPQLIYRAICVLCLQSIIVAGVGTVLSFAISADISYVSPLQISGGDIIHYEVHLIHSLFNSPWNDNRLQLFAPWATGLGMAGNTYILLALQETDYKWRTVGIIGSVMMVIFSWSRLAVVTLFFMPIILWILSNFIRPWVQFTTSIICFLSGIFFVNIIDLIYLFQSKVDSLRSNAKSSSNTRKAIYELTLYRWRTEAPIWGHGVAGDKGPALIDHYPIGSHQTWYYLLYAYGLVGFLPCLLVVIWTFIKLLLQAQDNQQAKLCLGILLVVLLNSFTDNIQSFAYLYWPVLVMLGIHLKQSLSFPHQTIEMMPQRQY
jgi:hypothetical protein